MKIKRCFLGIVILGALAPGVGWGASTATDSANSGNHGAHDSASGATRGAEHRNDQSDQLGPTAPMQHKGVATPTPAQNGASKPSRKVRDRARASEPSAGTKALATAALTPGQNVPAAPHFGPDVVSPSTVAAVSGNAVARHTSVKAAVGGPITSDTKHGALVIIGGTAMSRIRHSPSGDRQ